MSERVRLHTTFRPGPVLAEGRVVSIHERGHEMVTFGSRVSLEAAEVAARRGEYLALEVLEANLDDLLLQAKAKAREDLAAAQSSRGHALERNPIPAEMVDQVARGALYALVSPGEEHALAQLLERKWRLR